MDLPKPPEDQELKNIIDKLAQFVARNGFEFEQMTKQKQKDNRKFSFLFGGEYFNYYQYRVTSEQAILRQRQKQEQHIQHQQPPPTMNAPTNNFVPGHMMNVGSPQMPVNRGHYPPAPQSQLSPAPQNPMFSPQINDAQEQIRQSEQNLMAQHQVLMKQQQMMIEDTIRKAQEDSLRNMAQDFSINLHEFENVLQPIIESCTKDSISYGKSWIFAVCSIPVHYDIVCKYLLKRVLNSGQTFDAKLHVLYLINDLLNHCVRKGCESLKRSLESVIVPIYCFTFFEADEEKQQRLIKLLKLWESNQYVDQNILDQLQKPQMALAAYQAALCNEFSALISPITSGTVAKYSQLQKQHNEFVAHQTAKIQQLQQQQHQIANIPMSMAPPQVSSTQPIIIQNQPPMQSFGPPQPPSAPIPSSMPMYPQMIPPHSQSMAPSQPVVTLSIPPQLQHSQHHSMLSQPGPPLVSMAGNHNPPPFANQPLIPPPIVTPTIQSTSVPNPQFFNSAPPSGPPPIAILNKDVPPDVAYYELPAGLMVPLVKLEDFEYNAIDPLDIRLPPPAPPNERLLKAVEAFYAPPSHDRPRNSEGWEQLGLYEFFRAKSQARKVKDSIQSFSSDDDSEESFVNQKGGEHSRSNRQKNHSPSPKRRYRESRSPRKNRRRSSSSRSSSRSSNRSRSASRSRSRSKSPPPRNNNFSPPHFVNSYGNRDNRKIDESNKGHQLLKKMGWSGAGLGITEQGMKDPLHGGQVRDKQDTYRGVGMESVDLNDPYEAFRKNKGQAFMHRVMKGRAETK